ncbi:MAG: hypothetical protein Alpg2KO_29370 [Alphaproteobacteria bacterium]
MPTNPETPTTPAETIETDSESLLPEALAWRHDSETGAPYPANKPAFIGDTIQRQVESGDTLSAILTSIGAEPIVADSAVKAIRPLFDPANLRPGQALTIRISNHMGRSRFDGFDLEVSSDSVIEVNRVGASSFVASLDSPEMDQRLIRASGIISSNLMADGRAVGVPSQVLNNMIRQYGSAIDFSRDLRKGDRFELLYEVEQNSMGQTVRAGNLIYANVTLRGKDHQIYRFRSSNGQVGYFGPDGSSLTRTLLITPVKGLRISSRFGPRWHPILRQRRMHKGVDYAGPRGTPILAAGDGVIELAGRRGSFGNYIRIKHNSEFKTAYAHLQRIKGGVRPGTRVRQGQVIGYLGTTGRSTGPHLHYEVHRKGKAVDPLKLRLPRAVALSRTDLRSFRQHIAEIDSQRVALEKLNLPDASAVAENQ